MNEIINSLPLTEEEENRIRHFRFFSVESLVYALFYTFCLYKNASGITYPFFIGGTLFYFFLSLKKLGISAKKDSIFYIISLMLLGISTFCTDSGSILFLNKLGIFVLSFVLMIHNFCADEHWNFSKYIGSICRLLFGSLEMTGRPFCDLYLYLTAKKAVGNKKNTKGKYVFLGILISIPFAGFVVMLLCTADVVFDSIICDLLFDVQLPSNFMGICFTLLFSFLAAYCLITYLAKRRITDEVKDKRTGEPVLAITVTSILSVIYLLFSGIQIVYLFVGNMELPSGYTYAEYAREGFFQLLFICLMNIVLVLTCLGRFKESKVLKGILTVISLCTYIMIASSAMRMSMYIYCYALTFLRIFVLWALVVIFLLMTGVLIYIYKEEFPLFKYSMVMITVLYISLSFSHPDYLVAKFNLTNMDFYQTNGYYVTDVYYLSELSADAAPALLGREGLELFYKQVPPEDDEAYIDHLWILEYIAAADKYAARTTRHIQNIQAEGTTFRTFNLSRFIAQGYIALFEEIME